MPSINKIGLNGSKFQIQSSYERITVEETTNRFVDTSRSKYKV
jgi:hypothetical protein